jgi:ABC-type nitrate/sulfonate/bicarbonate transport system substrate-binding protein
MTKRIRLALDWTPNTIHTGFYVAAHKGWYENVGIEVEFLSSDEDSYATSPAKKVAEGLADLAIAPSESAISFQTKENFVPLIAIAAVLAKDASAIVALQSSDINRPAQLDSRTYASYDARFENFIVNQMILNDGGRGDFNIIYPDRLGIWSTLLSGSADATWVFLPWEGVEARLKGIELNAFQLGDYDIPYGYSPVLLAHSDYIQNEQKTLKAFLQATARGYQFAKNDPIEAARILQAAAPQLENTDPNFIEQSQVFISQYYFDEQGNWGVMQIKIWEEFVDWLKKENILEASSDVPMDDLDVYQLFTNEFFE